MRTREFHTQVSMVTETSVNMLLTPWSQSRSLSPGADGNVKVLIGNWDEEDQTEIGIIGLGNAMLVQDGKHPQSCRGSDISIHMAVS